MACVLLNQHVNKQKQSLSSLLSSSSSSEEIRLRYEFFGYTFKDLSSRPLWCWHKVFRTWFVSTCTMHCSIYILSLNSVVVSIKPEAHDNFHVVTTLFRVLRKKKEHWGKLQLCWWHITIRYFWNLMTGRWFQFHLKILRSRNAVVTDCRKLKLRIWDDL
jgi:hypothetical protein